MSSSSIIRKEPRGRPAIGFQLEVPGASGLEVQEQPFVCRERRSDGRLVGELEASVFAGALIIDRDGILAEKARAVLCSETGQPDAVSVPVVLPGARGFRAEAVVRTALPYVYVFAVAPADLGVDGGVVVAVRSATPDWAAGEHMLRSLRLITRNGRLSTDYDAQDTPFLPVVAAKR